MFSTCVHQNKTHNSKFKNVMLNNFIKFKDSIDFSPNSEIFFVKIILIRKKLQIPYFNFWDIWLFKILCIFHHFNNKEEILKF